MTTAILGNMSLAKTLFISLVLAVCVAPALAQSVEVEAVTKPKEDRLLAFVRPGQISEVLVKEGDTVRAGQLLAKLEDEAEQVELRQLEAEGNDQIRIDAAIKQLEQKREDAKKLREAAVKEWDIKHAELEAEIADLSLKLARFEQAQAKLKAQEAKANLKRMRIESPIDGKIEVIARKEGESVEANQQIIRLVNINPLRIDAPVPTATAQQLKLDGAVTVVFPDNKTRTGKIVFIATVADAASNTMTVRIEVQNDDNRQAGEHVKVVLATDGKPPAAATTSNEGGGK